MARRFHTFTEVVRALNRYRGKKDVSFVWRHPRKFPLWYVIGSGTYRYAFIPIEPSWIHVTVLLHPHERLMTLVCTDIDYDERELEDIQSANRPDFIYVWFVSSGEGATELLVSYRGWSVESS